MEKTNLFLGSILAGMAVAAGAFGAHGLQQITTDAQVLHTYQTAVQYHFWHAIALLICGALSTVAHPILNYWARQSFLAGLACFSGSLYFLTYLRINQLPVSKWVVLITPVGGLFFITAWVLLAFSFAKFKPSN